MGFIWREGTKWRATVRGPQGPRIPERFETPKEAEQRLVSVVWKDPQRALFAVREYWRRFHQ